jgi:hypothetical protein
MMSSSPSEVVEALAPNTYAIMVHKKLSDRVVDCLLTTKAESCSNKNWRLCSINHSPPPLPATLAATLASKEETDARGVQILDATEATVLSHDRRGYFVLLLPATQRPVAELPPMARQHISWIGLLSHKTSTATQKDTQLGRLLWETCTAQGFSSSNPNHFLRVDCHPPTDVEHICRALQVACAAQDSNGTPLAIDDPFEGPVPMTVSQSKCTHRLTVVTVRSTQKRMSSEDTKNDGDDKSTTRDDDNEEAHVQYFWGLESRTDTSNITCTFTTKLNQLAAREIITLPCDHETGKELSEQANKKKTKLDPSVPLSRAYYKLHQVWNDYLQNSTTATGKLLPDVIKAGAAMDLGASPGGWTQILALEMAFQVVVAVDPAKLATRVTQLPNVLHLPTTLELADYNAPAQGLEGYSMLVCDASRTYSGLLEMLPKHVLKRASWCLPAVFVVTMKFPFKTPGSIQSHVDVLHEQLPQQLRDMAAIMYPNNNAVVPSFRLVHLMANSDSERTLLAIFQEDTADTA